MQRRLYRSRENRIIGGVMGGIGEYYDTDPVIIRLVFLLITLMTGLVPGVLAYLIALLIVPEAPIGASSKPVEPEVVHDAEAV